ncbi:hypothetical protein QBC33DRAFT_88240 [Phialemonium atrogriseum]|uniref:tRNA-splicing endonuclease subunit Sen34 n=1 Tax=Phialemonium atrogriseum TaxID=1093897 RepID=A0AAJ0C152_9PEZI|nr:uncharacterized protein QBC33DRAFT_88240 [Phialemonium atrogriseum]KAK1766777.1 hypothetical protein QBC33DRAFT_88240 [Phialemonium atrogriseum]
MASAQGRQVRISKIASRYLVFDVQDVVYLRRHHDICAVFVGTMPQNPTQNIFMGLPVELLPEEASVLVNKKVAYIVDDPVAHLAELGAMDETSRKSYLQSLRTQRRNAQKAIDEEKATRMAEARARRQKNQPSRNTSEPTPARPEEEASLFDTAVVRSPLPVSGTPSASQTMQIAPGITPATSKEFASGKTHMAEPDVPKPCPLYAHLNSRGYFMTPGLRFGGNYSVYPGDPFRYHAHFLASSYGWDQEITLLDLVGSGRLGTAVKKGFLLGGQKPEEGTAADTDAHATGDWAGGDVRVFCIEWAGM